jgi:hypothetical protein
VVKQSSRSLTFLSSVIFSVTSSTVITFFIPCHGFDLLPYIFISFSLPLTSS